MKIYINLYERLIDGQLVESPGSYASLYDAKVAIVLSSPVLRFIKTIELELS